MSASEAFVFLFCCPPLNPTRLVGGVLLDGEDVNLMQVEAGMAWHYKQYQGEQGFLDRWRYSRAETEARDEMNGLWNDPNPIPPWDYRHGHRSGTSVSMQPVMSGFTCGTKRYCRQMSSCNEALYYLNQCGLTRLDGDSDGVPCESICR
jgi:hypothetical protein